MTDGGTRHVANHAGRQQMLQSAAMEALMMEAAAEGAVFAASIAPVRTGAYRNSFVVEGDVVQVGGKNRAGARLVNTSPYAWAVERGRGAHHVLSRTAAFLEGG